PVDLDPVLLRQLLLQLPLHRLRTSRLHIAPPRRDPRHVHVNADAALSGGNAKREIGALGTHATKRLQNFRVRRKLAAELLDGANRDVMDLLRLPRVERRRMNQLVDLGRIQPRYLFRTWRDLE